MFQTAIKPMGQKSGHMSTSPSANETTQPSMTAQRSEIANQSAV
jgi:hypothetical protein